MKLVLPSYSSSLNNETETIDHYFRVNNILAIHQYFELYPGKVDTKEVRVNGM